tara:strand:- start:8318 stop:8599 length:282 start_codon:yes stop_codon:yes gene_type:complete
MIPYFPLDDANIYASVPSELFISSSRYSTSSGATPLFFEIFDQESERRLNLIKKNVGDQLFKQLNEKQKHFLSNVVGTVSLAGAKPHHFDGKI